jgi:hypothetical protein
VGGGSRALDCGGRGGDGGGCRGFDILGLLDVEDDFVRRISNRL